MNEEPQNQAGDGQDGAVDFQPENELKELVLQHLPQPLGGLLEQALDQEVTDIHLDPGEDGWVMRRRVHGELVTEQAPEPAEGKRLLNQAKVVAGLRNDRLLVPDEGRVRVRKGERLYDVRVSVAPVVEGEAVHLRMLSAHWEWENLGQLGFTQNEVETISETLKSRSGLILIAGATGGGKTTTLYALTTLVRAEANVIASMEDPVEYEIPGVRQVQVDQAQGLTMATGLRTLLRMDPDMILVGEIRDSASAGIAGRAALTGTLVGATVHAPGPWGALAVLRNLEVPRYVIGGALRMIITQELLPTLCPQCARARPLQEEERELFEHHAVVVPETLRDAVGCPACHGLGYAGRTAVTEVLPVGLEAGRILATDSIRAGLEECFENEAVDSLTRNALRRAAAGDIPFSSVQRLILARHGSRIRAPKK